MPADIAILCEIRNFILVVAELFERLHGVEIHVRLRVVVRQVGAGAVLIELRARLDLEPVAGNMVRLEIDHIAQRLHPLLACLVRQAEHQIDRNVVEASPARHRDCLLRLLVIVGSAQSLQLLVDVRLHADGNAVEASPAQLRQHRKRHRVRICLQRDLRVAADVEAAVDFGKNPAQTRGSKERRRAAAKVDGVYLIAHGAGRGLADVRNHRVEIARHQLLAARAGDGVEIAVFAFAAAKGNVDVDAETLFPAFHDRSAAHRAVLLIHHRASTPP